MKTKITFILLILALFSCNNDKKTSLECLPHHLQKGVIAFYPFNNGDLDDESGEGHHLLNTTSATMSSDRDGNSDCAYRFNDYINDTIKEYLFSTDTDFLKELTEFSISVWYKPLNSARKGGKYETLISISDSTGVICPRTEWEWSLGLHDCRKAVFNSRNSVWINDKYTDIDSFSCQKEVMGFTGKWHHVVAVRKNDTYKIYYNGNLENTENGDGICANYITISSIIGNLFIGIGFTGKIDDIIIYNRELSQEEVTDLYELDACCN